MENFKDMKICKDSEFCGGCIYQGVTYEEQLKTKNKQITDLIEEYGVSNNIYKGLLPAPSRYRYRNKMEYTFGDLEKDGPMTLGMHKRKHFMSIITVDECQLVPEDFNKILSATLKFANNKGYKFYHKKTHQGLLRNLIVRCGVRTDEIIVNIVTSSNGEFNENEYVKVIKSLELDKKLVGIMRTVNDNIADTVSCDELRLLEGRDYYYEKIMGLVFKVSIFSFFQTNIEAVEKLYTDAKEIIPDFEDKIVYDLYCGTGTISQVIAEKAAKVYGIEISEDAVKSANENAISNGIKNCEFLCGDVLKELDKVKEKPEVIVVDPPRVGMHPKVVDQLVKYGMEEILYISCNPKTLFINIGQFRQYGYEPIYLKGYDNFPGTKHTEMICLLKKEI
ncbi:MAG: 23S rRNA (uracil(1939)-C(5))-methyltransferase RlmD [Peptostreptococcaceae bacterium]|nr:23S rRNA (uracil(1939)-C(5))-methyltransferase RlmD [Peptostreptococcaceae bacterium]